MPIVDQREALRQLIEQRGEDYAGLSRLLGRNSAYVQQFISRGVPKRLAFEDALKLARYFGVNPAELGVDAPTVDPAIQALVRIPRLDVGASAGFGAFNEGESPAGHMAFEAQWLQRLGSSGINRLRFIRVQGDSMAPTLMDGDDILIDEGDAGDRLRDGIYVLRVEDTLMVKRIAVSPAGRSITIKSDNPSYPTWNGCNPADLAVIARVIWAGRKVA